MENLSKHLGDISSFADPLQPMLPISNYFRPPALVGDIHFIVEKPADETSGKQEREDASGKRKREDVDMSYDLMENWSTPITTLPEGASQLTAYLRKDLTEAEKVPLSHHEFSRLVSLQIHSKIMCKEADLKQLFRPSEDENADYLCTNYLLPAICREPPDENGTEASFISFWDRNIRDVFSAIITEGQTRCIRDSNQDTSTSLKRPDFALLTGGICAFRGEEKAPTFSGTHPREELTQKLLWNYDPAPYILGYFAVGTDVTLAAISPESHLTELDKLNLSFRRQRIKMITHIIKLCSVIQALRTAIGTRDFEEFAPIVRPTGVIIEVGSFRVRKTYRGENGVARVTHLKTIYELLKRKLVPNVDSLCLHKSKDSSCGIVYLQPRGSNAPPKFVQDVVDAIMCVLEALVIMHDGPDPVFHRDIRWPNIIRRVDEPRKWFLIDWDDASTLPTYAAKDLREGEHSPRVFADGHGAEVDVWAVGKLFLDASTFASPLSPAMVAIGKRMREDETMSAQQALTEIKSL
jgi:hypothetical protein